ncbi:MAG: tetratricopeptide repeat protein, partial [Anaerolineales bacterium]
MADVTLRAYVKEIDNLIERDQLDEAIAHSRHILQTYPKHLGTYRLLGKAYLEAKRFGDAADIFQRVLSAVPEDFVSHIGMAIVREDEGNLDAAIWHMERAFEANPANAAIRQELSRLIGRRDGLEPHKIRLTRGALARQYAQGELFPQAIAELRSALQEDPDRPDLEILLARMYWQSEQYEAAKTLCKQILEKLPYSFDANRIMAAIYQVTNNPEKAGEYHRRLAALDPYMAFVDSADSDPNQISASAVQVDHSDWLPGQPLPTADSEEPDWVSSLGVDLSEDEELPEVGSVPSWMSELEGEVSSRPGGAGSLSSELPEEALTEEGDIPEWMREAGWEESNGEIPEGPISFSDEELEALDSGGPMPIPEEERGDEEEIAPADIPDWLQDIAPSEIPAEPESEPEIETSDQEPDKKEFVPDWLADISSEADEVPPEPVEDTQEVQTPEAEKPASTPAVVELGDEDQPEVPTWVEDQAPGATSTIISWLGDRPDSEPGEGAEDEEQAVTDQEQVSSPVDDAEIPSWLDGMDLEELEEPSPIDEAETDVGEEEEAPSWLAGVADAASDMDLDLEAKDAGSGDLETEIKPPKEAISSDTDEPVDEDAWLRELAESEIEEEVPSSDEAPDWATEGEAEGVDAASPSEVPDWLDGIAETEDQEFPQAEEEEPEWLRGLDVEEEGTAEPAAAPRQEVPEWLQGIAEPSRPEKPPTTDDDSLIEEGAEAPPSWLDEYSEAEEPVEPVEDEFDLQSLREFEAEISTEPEAEEAAISRSPEDIGVGEDLDDEEVYEWLESLAQEQPGEAEAETSTPSAEVSMQEAAAIIDDSVPPEEPEASLDWLEDLASERGLDVDVRPQEDASQLAASKAQVEPSISQPEPVEEEEEEAPDWLREMASSPADETVVAPRPAELETELAEPESEPPEVPDWLDEATSIAAEVPAEPGEAEVQAAPEETPAVPTQEPEEPARQVEAPSVPEPAREETAQPSTPLPEQSEPELTGKEAEPVVPEPAVETPATPPAVVEPKPPEPEPVPEPTAEAPVDVPAEKKEVQPKAEQPEVKEKPKKPAKFKEPMTEPTQLLQSARQALGAGDAGRALS